MIRHAECPGAGAVGKRPYSGRHITYSSGVARVSTLLVLVGMLVLAGCGSRPAIEPEPRVVRVDLPVQVPCRVKAPVVPAWAADGLRKEDSLEVKVRALLAERRQRIGYERLLVVAVGSCQ